MRQRGRGFQITPAATQRSHSRGREEKAVLGRQMRNVRRARGYCKGEACFASLERPRQARVHM